MLTRCLKRSRSSSSSSNRLALRGREARVSCRICWISSAREMRNAIANRYLGTRPIEGASGEHCWSSVCYFDLPENPGSIGGGNVLYGIMFHDKAVKAGVRRADYGEMARRLTDVRYGAYG